MTLTKNSKVVVTYKAKLTRDAEYTATGNTNEVTLVYSNDPMSKGTGTSTPKKVTDYVFGLILPRLRKAIRTKTLLLALRSKSLTTGTLPLLANGLRMTGPVETKENASEFMTDATSGKGFNSSASLRVYV